MSDLTPEQIFNGYKNSKIDKSSAILYLRSNIDESNDYNVREECIKYLGEIKPNGNELFDYLENLVTSDEDYRMKGHAAKIIIEQYPFKSFELTKWIFSQKPHPSIIESAANALLNTPSDSLRSLLKDFLNSADYVVYKEKIHLIEKGDLFLTDLGISDISELKRLDKIGNKIGYLNLSGNKISEIKGLESCTNLKTLVLERNNISEIKGLDNCKWLGDLRLNNNKITEIGEFSKNLRSLYTLDLRYNQISEIKGLENLEDLTNLYLDNNQITEIKGLENNKKLYHLKLTDNKIKDLKGLEKLSYLKELLVWLAGNPITEINNLENLPYITDIWNLCNKELDNVAGPYKMPEKCIKCTKKCEWKKYRIK